MSKQSSLATVVHIIGSVNKDANSLISNDVVSAVREGIFEISPTQLREFSTSEVTAQELLKTEAGQKLALALLNEIICCVNDERD